LVISSNLATTFGTSIVFKCLPSCGLCCGYKVEVTEKDIRGVKNSGKIPAQFLKENSEKSSGYFAAALKKDGDKCVFLNNNKRCTIYPERPTYCRYFPFFIEGDGQIDIDLSCPGVGEGERVREDYFEFILNGEREKIRQYQTPGDLSLAENILTQHGLHISPDLFREAGENFCGSLLDSIENHLMSIKPWLLRFFQFRNCANIHKCPDGRLQKYRFEIKGRNIHIGNIIYPIKGNNFSPLSGEEEEIVLEYLKLWLCREIFYRFCLVNAFASIPGLKTTDVTYDFLSVLVNWILNVKDVLYHHWSKYDPKVNKIEMLKESIRALDGRLRSKCKMVNCIGEEGGNRYG